MVDLLSFFIVARYGRTAVTAARFLCIFRGLFSPFFEDFPEQITFFVLLYKTFYSHMPRLLEPLISYFDPWEKATDHGK